MKNPINIYVVDDNPQFLDYLKPFFEATKLKVKTFDCAEKFLDFFKPSLTGCLLLETRMPSMNGLDLLDKLNTMSHQLSIIILTGYADIPMAIRAMKSGAAEFLLKPPNFKQLMRILFHQLSIKKTSPKPNNKAISLTSREQEIIELIMQGKYNKQIAHILNISISTVEAHRARIMLKYEVKTIAELVKKYYQIIT